MDACIHTCDNMIMCHNPTGKWPKWNIYIHIYICVSWPLLLLSEGANRDDPVLWEMLMEGLAGHQRGQLEEGAGMASTGTRCRGDMQLAHICTGWVEDDAWDVI